MFFVFRSEFMQKNNLKPNKLLGQNFLRDKNVLRKIISAANLTTNDVVLEVGPGEGVLTKELARHAGRVIAVEKDKNLAALLKAKLANNKNVEIIEGDILELIKNPPPPSLKEGSKNGSPPLGGVRGDFLFGEYKVVANIPYYLTSRLIRLLLASANPPQDIILMVQKEVAKHICAQLPKMSLLAVSVQFYAQPKIIASVSKNAFWPKPKVDSAIIRITPHNDFFPLYKRGIEGDLKNTKKILPNPPFTKEGIANFFTALHAGFSHPRKQLLNNLSLGLKIPRGRVIEILRTANLEPFQRAETLSVNDWIKLTNAIFN